MRKLILIGAMAVIILNILTPKAVADPTPPWQQQMLDPQWRYQQVQTTWQAINHPILQKVFPGVQFKKGQGVYTLPVSDGGGHHIAGLYEDKAWHMTNEFNTLFARIPNTSKVTIAEKIEAFIRLDMWLQDSALTIDQIAEGKYEFGDLFKYEYKVTVNMNHWYKAGGPTQLEFYLKLFQNQIEDIYIRRDGHGEGEATPKLHSYLDYDDSDTLFVSGQGVYSEQLGDTTYYFLAVTNNDTLTGNYFHLKVTGLHPSQNVKMVVGNGFWQPDPILFFESDWIWVPANGTIETNWTPGTPDSNINKTGVCRFGVIDRNHNVLFRPDSVRLVPEKNLRGVYPQSTFNYSILYTNQFFLDHPDGIDSADYQS